MKPRRSLDVGHLPEIAFGSRDPLWWGVTGLIAIESTAFVLIWASYWYIRGNYDDFPPTGIGAASFRWAVAGAVLMVVSVPFMQRSSIGAEKSKLRGMRRPLGFGTVLGLAFVVCRAMEIHELPFRWDAHAYGSIVWFSLCMHLTHAIAGSVENVMLMVLLFRGPVEKKHLIDVHVNSYYWFFFVTAGLLNFAVLYGDPLR